MTSALHTTPYGEHGSRVVFLHGLFGQGRNWTGLAKALAADHRVLLVDLPDHGRSAWTEGFDMVEVADTVAAELRRDPEPVALVGHSLGGKVAMLVALRHPDLVERLCVVDISPVAYQKLSEFSGYIDALCGLDLASFTQRSDADAALAPSVPNTTVRSFLLQNLRRDGDSWRWQPNLEGLKRSLPGIGSWPEDRLAGTPPYPGPVVWIGGANSAYVTDDYAPAMDRWFPHNRRVIVKNAGHWVHSEQPEVFAEIIRRFLA
ncbi:pimeloyl-ACP methyl ester carboxylesterase [Marmoricola sp. OAE513]|uniref:alpha/beta fold hydrolase n=1 Tax=Marmoricola sp. OAE513 TaxID=2817894 RepID=UPI001AE600A2